jgi:ribokinase
LVARVQRAPERGETVTGSRFDIFGGGKGANQAVAAARAGAPVAMLGAVGQDDFGRDRLADLRRDGIDIESVAVIEGVASGVALITVEASGDNRIAYVPGATLTVTSEPALAALERSRPDVVLATLELPPPTLTALFAADLVADATILLNATPEAASGAELVREVDILIVNETEAVDVLGGERGERSWKAVASALRELGPSTVVITLGGEGALVATGNRFELLPAPPVEVVDTTAAGDTFCGAMAARLAAGDDVLAAATYGIRAASLSVTKAGAQPSIPTAAEIERLTYGSADEGRSATGNGT